MTTAIDGNDFEGSQYLPEIMADNNPSINAEDMEAFMRGTLNSRVVNFRVKGNTSIDIIDQTIRVKIPSDNFRAQKVSHWKEEHRASKKWAWIEGGMTGLLGLATAAASESPLVAATLGVCTLACLFFSGKNILKTWESTRQIDGWSASPVEKIANQRAKAYLKGFLYVYQNNLKLDNTSHTAVLLPYEVHFLFDRYFSRFCQNLLANDPRTEKGQKEWLDQFTSRNPLTESLLRYGNFDQIPAKYGTLMHDYQSVRKALDEIRDEFGVLRRMRYDETAKIKENIERNRQLALLPFIVARDSYIAEARKERDKEIRVATGEEGKIDRGAYNAIEKKYDEALRKYRAFYAAAALPINLVFDQQIATANDNLEKIFAEIRKNEASAHAPYYNYSRGLIWYANQALTTPDYAYTSQPFPTQIYNIPVVPSAPPVVQVNVYQQAAQQKPQGIDDSNYAEYLKFLQYQQTARGSQ